MRTKSRTKIAKVDCKVQGTMVEGKRLLFENRDIREEVVGPESRFLPPKPFLPLNLQVKLACTCTTP